MRQRSEKPNELKRETLQIRCVWIFLEQTKKKSIRYSSRDPNTFISLTPLP
jgi:hypothetical protein